MTFSATDSLYMAHAIALAKKGWYTTRSNPRVGCLLVLNEQVIGEGWHQKAGLPHAEVNAIADAKSKGFSVEGSTAYVTLEPCAHFGKTPPCAQTLIDNNVAKVICAMQDPNPLVAGKGIDMLRAAGIEVACGLLQSQAEALNLGFIKRMKRGLPRVVAKIAVSVDGRTAMADGQSQWITGAAAREDVQRLRAESGAVLTGSGTMMLDNPALNVRDERYITASFFEQPLRVVINSKQPLDSEAKFFKQEGNIWIVSNQIQTGKYPEHVCEKQLSSMSDGRVSIQSLLEELAQAGINDLLVEAGATLLGAMLEQQMVDELIIYMAPKLMGSQARALAQLPFDSMNQSINLTLMDIRQLDQDIRFHYKVIK